MQFRDRYDPTLDLRLPRRLQQSYPAGMKLYLSENAHQVCELTMMHINNAAYPDQRYRTPSGALWAENEPVYFRWGRSGFESGSFYGYVASARVESMEEDARFPQAVVLRVTYTLMGASFPLQSRKNRVWRDTSASAIARQIAQENQLQPFIERSSVRFAQRTQASSDWLFLCDIADQVGYRVYTDGTSLWFVSRDTVFPSKDGSVPVFHARKQPGYVDTLRSFEGTLGDTDPSGGVRARYETVAYNRTSNVMTPVSYSQPRTNNLGGSVDPLLRQQYGLRPAPSYAEAQRLLDADTEWLWNSAKAVVNGDHRLVPGSVCDLLGPGVGDQNQGRWIVRSAVHELEINLMYAAKGKFTSTLSLGRDDGYRLKLKVQTRTPQASPTILVQGRWRAQFSGEPR